MAARDADGFENCFTEVVSATPARSVWTEEYAAGDVIATRYELVQTLGSGGMGIVWLAHDRVLNVEVALKLILHPASEAPARAQTEARAAARLAHPAVCRVTDYGSTARGDPYVVTELLEGETLETTLERRGRLPAVEAVQALLPILDALDAAHAAGIVHRDVKPSNVFLAKLATGGIQPKLLDFGVARWVADKTRSTSAGCVVGTPDYMSPEQARGSRDVGPPSDVWNFCATLYEAMIGSSPFRGENYNEVLWAIQTVDPPLITARAVGDAELADIIAQGLCRSISERWASARDLAAALAGWLLAQGTDTDVAGRSVRGRAALRVPGPSRKAREPISPGRAKHFSRAGRHRRLTRAVAGFASLLALAGSAYAVKLVTSRPETPEGPHRPPGVGRAETVPISAKESPVSKPSVPELVPPKLPTPSSIAVREVERHDSAPPANGKTEPVRPSLTPEASAPPIPTEAPSTPDPPKPALAPSSPRNALRYDFGF